MSCGLFWCIFLGCAHALKSPKCISRGTCGIYSLHSFARAHSSSVSSTYATHCSLVCLRTYFRLQQINGRLHLHAIATAIVPKFNKNHVVSVRPFGPDMSVCPGIITHYKRHVIVAAFACVRACLSFSAPRTAKRNALMAPRVFAIAIRYVGALGEVILGRLR